MEASSFWNKVQEICRKHSLNLVFNTVEIDDDDFDGPAEYRIDEYGSVCLEGIYINGNFFSIAINTGWPFEDIENKSARSAFFLTIDNYEDEKFDENFMDKLDIEKAIKVSKEIVSVVKAKQELEEFFETVKVKDIEFVSVSHGIVEFHEPLAV